MTIFFNTIIFILGLCIGSFLNAFLYRYEEKKSISGRSFCPICKKELLWYDMVPVLSYFFLNRKCRHCKSQISFQYPLVEMTTGLLFFAFWQKDRNSLVLEDHLLNGEILQLSSGLMIMVLLLLAGAMLVLISVYDLKKKEIPNGFNLAFILFAMGYSLMANLSQGVSGVVYLSYLTGATLAFLFFYAFVYISKETWMGGGDAKLAFGMGLLLGPANVFVAILLATWLGAIIGMLLMAFGKAKAKTEIPFGPFLAFGAVVSFLFGSQIISGYAKIFLGL